MGLCHNIHVESEDNLEELFSHSTMWVCGMGTQIIGFSKKYLYLLSNLSGLKLYFFTVFSLVLFSFLFVRDRLSCSQTWLQDYYIAKDDLEHSLKFVFVIINVHIHNVYGSRARPQQGCGGHSKFCAVDFPLPPLHGFCRYNLGHQTCVASSFTHEALGLVPCTTMPGL